MKVAIVTYAEGPARYIESQKQQAQNLKDVGYDGDYFAFNSPEQIGCPPHSVVPYAFKPFAMAKVMEMGYDIVIWMDSVIQPIKPITGVISHLVAYGDLFFDNPQWTIGDYTSDECLEYFSLTRDESFRIPMIMACVMGLDMRRPMSQLFFQQYHKAAQDKVAYQGPWKYEDKVTPYYGKRILGTRHDQSAASCIVHKLGLPLLIGHETFFTYEAHKGMTPVAESVCLVSR